MSASNNQPILSILLPAYYSGDLLYDAVASIARQGETRWELIVCDDGTEGFCAADVQRRLRELIPTGNALTVLHHEKNLGTVKNLNSALAQAKGTWVMTVAADDCLADDGVLERLLTLAQQTEHDWIVSQTALCDEVLHPLGAPVPTHLDKTPEALYEKLCLDCFLPASGILYKADLLKSMGGFDEEYRLVEDWPLFLKLTRRGVMPEFAPHICVLHRLGGVSTRHAGKNQTYQQDLIRVMRTEVLPHLARLPKKLCRKTTLQCKDKIALYEYRFETPTPIAKLLWAVSHPGVLLRGMIRRGKERL